MEKKKMNLYIIAGCNGAGKTTASFTVLPEMLGCREFVNADEIAAGLSPFNPEGVAIQAGRLMIDRIIYLLKEGETFAFETTLATRSMKGPMGWSGSFSHSCETLPTSSAPAVWPFSSKSRPAVVCSAQEAR